MSETIPPEDERVSDAEIARIAVRDKWEQGCVRNCTVERRGSPHSCTCQRMANLIVVELQSRRSRPDREAIIEECAKVAEGKKPIVAGNYYRGQREQSDKIAKAIRSLKHSDTTEEKKHG